MKSCYANKSMITYSSKKVISHERTISVVANLCPTLVAFHDQSAIEQSLLYKFRQSNLNAWNWSMHVKSFENLAV